METFTLRGSAPEAYERYLVPVLFRPLAERLLARVRPRPAERLLDVACGTGVVARVAAEHGVRCTGVDLSPDMLVTARELAPDLEWIHGDASALPLPDHSYDVVVCQQGLQFMPDPAAAVREMRRVLVPGGRLLVAVWRDLAFSPGFAAYVEMLDRQLGAEASAVLRGPFSMGDAEAVRSLLTGAGFESPRDEVEIVVARFGSAEQLFVEEVAATPLAELVVAAGADKQQAMAADLAELLADRTDDGGVVFPMETHVFQC